MDDNVLNLGEEHILDRDSAPGEPAEGEAVRPGPAGQAEANAFRTRINKAWNLPRRLEAGGNLILAETKPAPMPAAAFAGSTAEPAVASALRRDPSVADLSRLLAEAQTFAADYGAMKARTRAALYQALGRTYDLSILADAHPEQFGRLIEQAGLFLSDRAPYTPVVKLVFGAGYDKTRLAEFAAAIAYGRRKNLPVGGFAVYLIEAEGGLKAIIGLERLIRKGDEGPAHAVPRSEARPALARKLRTIVPQAWEDLEPSGDEFGLLITRRLPDGSLAMVGEVPRDIGLLEKAARKLLAERGRTVASETEALDET